jgi:hypothetical protein
VVKGLGDGRHYLCFCYLLFLFIIYSFLERWEMNERLRGWQRQVQKAWKVIRDINRERAGGGLYCTKAQDPKKKKTSGEEQVLTHAN